MALAVDGAEQQQYRRGEAQGQAGLRRRSHQGGGAESAVNGQQQVAAVGCGFVEITGEKVVVITDFAMEPEEINIEHVERAKVRAEERMREKKSQIEFAHSQAELARAMAKLKEEAHKKLVAQ